MLKNMDGEQLEKIVQMVVQIGDDFKALDAEYAE
jgi:hypothetical protein